jgi:hypothetical protein
MMTSQGLLGRMVPQKHSGLSFPKSTSQIGNWTAGHTTHNGHVCVISLYLATRCVDDDDDDDDDENNPVWPTWAVGVLSGVRNVEAIRCAGIP